MDFSKNQTKEFIQRVEDDIAQFVGAEFLVARLVGNISRQHALGEISNEQAAQLLRDIQHLGLLVKTGHRYAKWARNPPAEIEIMVLADYEREKQTREVKRERSGNGAR